MQPDQPIEPVAPPEPTTAGQRALDAAATRRITRNARRAKWAAQAGAVTTAGLADHTGCYHTKQEGLTNDHRDNSQ